MHVLMLTYGTRGDVEPFVALGQGLRRAGHAVTLATSTRFETFVTERGLRFAPLRDDLLAILDTDRGRAILEKTRNVVQIARSTMQLMNEVGPIQRGLLADCWEAALATKPDLIVFHPKTYGGVDIAEKLAIPAVLGLLQPTLVPTSERPALGFPALRLGGWYNRMTYRVMQWLISLSAGKHARAWRAQHGLPKRRFDFLRTRTGEALPVLHAFSEHVVPRPADWPSAAQVTGYWFPDETREWVAPGELTRFLREGPAPVYVGFGSMAGRDPRRIARTVVEALRIADARGVIATGWGGMDVGTLPATVHRLAEAPHAWLFPRMAAVVHHGGAGTTAAGLRVGVPSVIVPFFGDQPFWGARVSALGVGPQPIPQRKLTSHRLAGAIRAALGDREIRANAARLGERVRAECGVESAVKLLERVTRRHPSAE